MIKIRVLILTLTLLYVELVTSKENAVKNYAVSCPIHAIKQLTVEDVEISHVENNELDSSLEFTNLISQEPPSLGEYFRSRVIPNEGYFVLYKPFIFTGFTTQGDVDFFTHDGDYISREHYVSEFTIKLYSNYSVTNGIYQFVDHIHTFNITAKSANEEYFGLYSHVPSRVIQFTVKNFMSPGSPDMFSTEYHSYFYYWRIRLFGYDAIDEKVIDFPANSSEVSALSSSSTVVPYLSTAVHTVTVTELSSSSTVVPYLSTVMRTVTVTETAIISTPTINTEAVGGSPLESDGISEGALAGAVVPLLVIIALLITILVMVLLWIYSKRNAIFRPKDTQRNCSDTLKEFNNMQLYSPQSTLLSSTSSEAKPDEAVVINTLYDSTTNASNSEVALGPISQMADPSQDGGIRNSEYSSIDQYYPTSSNYESVRDNFINPSLPRPSDSDHTAVNDIEFTSNPSYSVSNPSRN